MLNTIIAKWDWKSCENQLKEMEIYNWLLFTKEIMINKIYKYYFLQIERGDDK